MRTGEIRINVKIIQRSDRSVHRCHWREPDDLGSSNSGSWWRHGEEGRYLDCDLNDHRRVKLELLEILTHH